MTDSLLKCVKRGKTDEQALAAECIRLLAIQLGTDLGPLYSDIQSVLSILLADNTASVQTRAQVRGGRWPCLYSAINILNFIHFIIPFWKFGPHYLGKATAAARAALPSPICASWVILCFRNPLNSDMDYKIFNVRT